MSFLDDFANLEVVRLVVMFMTASPSVQNVIFGSQSIKRARTGLDGTIYHTDLLGVIYIKKILTERE